jgi:hypothetical protein
MTAMRQRILKAAYLADLVPRDYPFSAGTSNVVRVRVT